LGTSGQNSGNLLANSEATFGIMLGWFRMNEALFTIMYGNNIQAHRYVAIVSISKASFESL
jgi:hypothetical protein